MIMLSDSESSDDDILRPNGFEDVNAELVEVNISHNDAGDFHPRKRKRGSKNSSRGGSFDSPLPLETINPEADAEAEDEPPIAAETSADSASFLVLDDPSDVNELYDTGRGTRRSKRIALKHTACSPRKTRQKSINNSSAVVLVDDSTISAKSSKHIFDSTMMSQTSFCEELDDDLPELNVEDPNTEVRIRVVWKGMDTKHFTIRKFQNIKEIYSYYANLEGIQEERVLFTLRDKPISPFDTPATLNIGVSSLEGGMIDVADISSHPSQNAESQSQIDPNALRLSVLRKGMKEKHTVYTYPHEKVSVLISKLSEELNIPSASMKLMIDGEVLDGDETPADHDLENDDCVDLVVTI